jgi:hypothetical protein
MYVVLASFAVKREPEFEKHASIYRGFPVELVCVITWFICTCTVELQILLQW